MQVGESKQKKLLRFKIWHARTTRNSEVKVDETMKNMVRIKMELETSFHDKWRKL